MSNQQRFSARTESILASLKPFQRDSADHAFERLWLAPGGTGRFLVADEVGLGKTMVAKGIIARAVDHLERTQDRIDVVYICSNSQIARQNLARLNVVGGSEVQHADRLTLLPQAMKNMRSEKINFISFTPGTSFNVGQSGGRYGERVLLYWMLYEGWGPSVMRPARWKRFFEGQVQRHNFENYLEWFDRSSLDPQMSKDFVDAIEGTVGPRGGPLREELEACALRYNYLRGKPDWDLQSQTVELIGALRALVAAVSVRQLKPDLVILDEFQRFKDLLSDESPGAQLARRLFTFPGAKVLLLSATPYKMYTLPDEPDGEDHYRDFTQTMEFLDEERAGTIETNLKAMRQILLSRGDPAVGRAARDAAQTDLRKVMSRVERVGAAADAMVEEQQLSELTLTRRDVRAWCALDAVGRAAGSQDLFEYWRSAPYLLNLMDRGSYQVLTKFEAAVDARNSSVRKALHPDMLLSWSDIRDYNEVDPGNAKLRALTADVLDRGTWKLAWLPPSLPYYTLGEEYADPQVRRFTKRLVFSAWQIVPKSIAVMLSYDAERRTVDASEHWHRKYESTFTSRPLEFPVQTDARGQRRLAGMPALAVLYPSTRLARLGDPLAYARETGEFPVPRETLFAVVRDRVQAALACLPDPVGDGTAPDQRWYWAAPFLLDRLDDEAASAKFFDRMAGRGSSTEGREEAGHDEHVRMAASLDDGDLGRRPDDLADVITTMAIAGPGVAALRALSRVAGGEAALSDVHVRVQAHRITHGLRALFNKPEIALLLRTGGEETRWQAVLDHCYRGGLQAVLDEYAHVLIESEGLQDASDCVRATTVADVMGEALGLRSAVNRVRHIEVSAAGVDLDDERHSITSHLAARYGRAQDDGQNVQRETTVRVAFNSPFRPFVLASTSVGQEGLDFHTYSHAIVHWNLPSNPVDLEQREGRVHRYKGHAVRKNVATDFGWAAATGSADDPWQDVFNRAVTEVGEAEQNGAVSANGLRPFWIYTGSRSRGSEAERPALIERYVPALPLSREIHHYERLKRTVAAYRLVMGQPRQDDLIEYISSFGEGSGNGAADTADWLQIDLTPPGSGAT